MSKIRIVAETGSDLTPELAKAYGIELVPMHVTFGSKTLDDGSFDPRKIYEYYRATGKTPTTSGSNTEDFAAVFDRIHESDPAAQILYLAYSAGQALVCVCTARAILVHPEWNIAQAKQAAEEIAARAHVAFVPRNLDFLRAGKALLGGMLHIVPLIDVLDGKLVAAKSYRGGFAKVIRRMMAEYAEKYAMDRELLFVALTPDFEPELRDVIEETARTLSFRNISFLPTGGVITSHGGIGAFGIAGLSAV